MALVPPKPEELSKGKKASIRFWSGVRKAAIYGGIALAAVTGASLVFGLGHIGTLAAGVGLDTLFGTGIAGAAATGLFLGVPAAAAGVGFLLGATDERPVKLAQAELRREGMQARMDEMNHQKTAMASRQQAIEYERQKHLLGMADPEIGGLSPPLGGGSGGGGFGGIVKT